MKLTEKINIFKKKIKKNIYKISVVQNKGLSNYKEVVDK